MAALYFKDQTGTKMQLIRIYHVTIKKALDKSRALKNINENTIATLLLHAPHLLQFYTLTLQAGIR